MLLQDGLGVWVLQSSQTRWRITRTCRRSNNKSIVQSVSQSVNQLPVSCRFRWHVHAAFTLLSLAFRDDYIDDDADIRIRTRTQQSAIRPARSIRLIRRNGFSALKIRTNAASPSYYRDANPIADRVTDRRADRSTGERGAGRMDGGA